eukprot:gene63460-86804_t
MTPPDGFELLTRPSPLIDPWRPLYVRNEPDRVALGILVREPHTNSRGTVHGGLFAALADQGMGMTCVHRLRTDGVPRDDAEHHVGILHGGVQRRAVGAHGVVDGAAEDQEDRGADQTDDD